MGSAPRFVDSFFGGERFVGLVVARFERQIRLFRTEYGGLGARVQEARRFQFLVARQVVEAGQAEMLEEELGRAPGDGPEIGRASCRERV